MIWLNIDKPTRKCTLHANSQCTHLLKKKETMYKGLGRLKRDGGWLYFGSTRVAVLYFQGNLSGYELITHC